MTATSWTTQSSSSWAMKGPGGQIPYTVTVPTGKVTAGGSAPFTLSAQIAGTAYANAVGGDYSDQLTLMVTP